MFLTDNKDDADKVRKWSTQSRETVPWYQHEEIGYNYRMSNINAGVVRGQLFSIYFNKEITFYTRDHASRMISLANRLGIQEQCGDTRGIEDYQPIRYEIVNQKVDEFRKISIAVL